MPKIEVPKAQLEKYLEQGMSVAQVATACGCSKSVIYRRVAEFGLQHDPTFKYISSQKTRLLYINKATLSSRQRSIIIGAVLGDGYLNKRKNYMNASFQFGQSIKRQDYVRWMAVELEPFTSWVNEHEKSILFGTAHYPEFTWFHDMFYPDGKKIVPENIGEYVDEQALAGWFMDDGCTYVYFSFLSTQGFTKAENELLRRVLENRFGIEAKVIADGQSKVDGRPFYRLYIGKKNHYVLHEIVDPLMHGDFEYKKLPQGKVYVGHVKGVNHFNAKLSGVRVTEIERMWATGRYTQKEIASEYGIHQTSVSRIIRGYFEEGGSTKCRLIV